ncbi:MAG: hypothetical protein QM704_14880 [Anaeromyxobacteraceae bacterium]
MPRSTSRRCTGPGCTRPARALGLCVAHYRQRARGGPLTALRGSPGAAMVMLTVRVPVAVREAARRDPDGARATLDRWAKTRRKP